MAGGVARNRSRSDLGSAGGGPGDSDGGAHTNKAEWRPRVPAGARIFVIGDIHGRRDLLRCMARKIETDLAESPSPTALTVFVGDYVDRGPASDAVVEQLSQGDFPTPIVPLRGNHEAMLLDCLSNPTNVRSWCKNGGLDTLNAYGVSKLVRRSLSDDNVIAEFGRKLPAKHSEFLASCLPFFCAGDYFFCHAGVRPGVPLHKQKQSDLLWIREPFLSSSERFERMVVHGHTPVLNPDVRANRINIDTGAFLTGRLTCLVLEADSHRFLSTRSV
jgi:serine/threonine protein phosphatase 1